MPATNFICPNGTTVSMETCLSGCPHGERCMFLPTLRAVAKSANRNIAGSTVTELLSGCRETYLKKTTKYAVDPQKLLYAMQGTAIHNMHDNHTSGEILSEIRLSDSITSGQFDMYGQLLDEETGTLGDLKVTSSYKLQKALGIYKKPVPTGEVYKTGAKKGQPKTRMETFYDGVHHVFEWAVQLNYYRMLLEKQGFTVNKMYIQAVCRDGSLRIANERGIDKTVYIIPINKISDRWLERYYKRKAEIVQQALDTNTIPSVCSRRERWNDRKCLNYCNVCDHCSHGRELIQHNNEQNLTVG